MGGRERGGLEALGRAGDAVDVAREADSRAASAAPTETARTPHASSLTCRHLWKVFGPDSKKALRSVRQASPEVGAVIDKLRASGHVPAVCDVSFAVERGEIFVIMGLSGSGKSTVVRCLSRLIEATEGEVLIDGQDLLKLSEQELIELRRHKMGMVFQNFGLLPHLNVLENVAYPLRVQGVPRAEREARAREMVELVGLGGRETSAPRELSGGMQQRVGIARSLAVKPDIWFLDEPFSALDPLIRRQMQDEFLRLQAQLKKTIVFITHDFLEALKLADRIAIMRRGRFVQVGTGADLVLRPVDDYVADFTRDVPRDKVVTAGSIAEPVGDRLDGAEPVSAEATLDVVMQLLAERGAPIAVAGSQGRIIGRITAEGVVAALAASGAPRS
jgi:glycine betaine/proline transport system ATP-binding protein